MTLLYGLLSLAAFILIVVCLIIDKKRNIYLLLLFCSVFVANMGNYLTSLAPTLTFALNANRITYIGQVFLPYFILKMILLFCNVQYSKKLDSILLSIGFIVLLITLTPGVFPYYYKAAELSTTNGYSQIIHEYGPLYTIYVIYLLLYTLGTLGVVLNAIRKKWVVQKAQIVFLYCAVLCNFLIYVLEKLVPQNFEILTISYLITEIFILLLYCILQEYELLRTASSHTNNLTVAHKQPEVSELYSFSEESIRHILSVCPELSVLTERETEVLKGLLYNKKRKEIATELYISESAIGKHTTSIFRKLEVNSRKELYAKLISHVSN